MDEKDFKVLWNNPEKQGEPNPFSGVSFEYDGHIWGMCARDNGVEIIFDGELKAFLSLEKSFIYPIHPQKSLAPKSAMEAIKEEKVDNANKIETKFKVGEWIVDESGFAQQVLDFRGGIYTCTYNSFTTDCESNYHLWTIQGAKDGDVLVNGSNIFIFHFINDTRLMGYCHVNTDDGRFYNDIGQNECFCLIDAVVNPATKEQRVLLFQKMKDAGYEWDSEKKWLRKIEKQKQEKKFDAPKGSIKDDESITSRMKHIPEQLKPIAEFVIQYAHWNLHSDEWNQTVPEVPLFRVLDALVQNGEPYKEE